MDIKKIIPIINGVGVLVMFLWGTLGNDWGHSWIAVCVSGIISGILYSYGNSKDQ